MAIKNIVFDIGNVLADYRWYDFLKDKGFSHDMIDRIAGNSTLSPLWNEYDRGVLTAEQVVDSFIRRDPEIADAFHIAFDNLKDLVTPFDYAVELVRSLGRAGYRVYYLSNYSQKALEDCPDAMGFLPYTDGGIFSFREKLIKPDPAIYRLLLERYDLAPEETVFLDDRQENVDGAEKVGMCGIVFRSLKQAVQSLKEMGVEFELKL